MFCLRSTSINTVFVCLFDISFVTTNHSFSLTLHLSLSLSHYYFSFFFAGIQFCFIISVVVVVSVVFFAHTLKHGRHHTSSIRLVVIVVVVVIVCNSYDSTAQMCVLQRWYYIDGFLDLFDYLMFLFVCVFGRWASGCLFVYFAHKNHRYLCRFVNYLGGTKSIKFSLWFLFYVLSLLFYCYYFNVLVLLFSPIILRFLFVVSK